MGMETSPQQPTWRVVRKSLVTGRVLKILVSGLSRHHAELFAEGFGRDSSSKTTIRVEQEV